MRLAAVGLVAGFAGSFFIVVLISSVMITLNAVQEQEISESLFNAEGIVG